MRNSLTHANNSFIVVNIATHHEMLFFLNQSFQYGIKSEIVRDNLITVNNVDNVDKCEHRTAEIDR